MPGSLFDRRTFIRTGALAALGAAAAACSSGKPDAGATTSATPSPSPTPTGPQRVASWRRLNRAGPSARSHHTLTSNAEGSIVFLFGGKQGARVLRDAWAFERSTGLWSPLPTGGPPARFGHSAAYVDGHWVIFGGQNGGKFYNDAWVFDSIRGNWIEIKGGDAKPATRYGAGGATIANSLTVSHGINAKGRLDDTWALSAKWTNVTPRSGPRPAKRCLHRAEYLTDITRMALFGGQGDTSPFLGDTWLYDPRTLAWTQVKAPGPSPRNLSTSVATANTMYLFGGAARGGPLRDLWSFDGTVWRQLRTSGGPPRARSASEGALMAGSRMLMFGGHDGSRELADFWELQLPA